MSSMYLKNQFIDNGCGISEKNMENVFKPLFTTKDSGKGTGIGIAFVNAIVQSLNGEIKLESKLNKGTKITVLLPLENGGVEK